MNLHGQRADVRFKLEIKKGCDRKFILRDINKSNMKFWNII